MADQQPEALNIAINALQCARHGQCDHAMADEAIAALRAQVERLQAACRSQTAESDSQAGLSLTGATQEAADTGADWPKPSQWDSPLSDFQDGQWWVKELDSMASAGGTPDQKRAVAVVHHLLRAALAALAAQLPAERAMVPLSHAQIIATLTSEFPHPSLVPMLKGSVICGDFHKALVAAVQVGIAEFCRINGLTVGGINGGGA